MSVWAPRITEPDMGFSSALFGRVHCIYGSSPEACWVIVRTGSHGDATSASIGQPGGDAAVVAVIHLRRLG
jgi:hypothetical protein